MEKQLLVRSSKELYPVIIGDNLLSRVGERIKAHVPKADRSFLITDENVGKLYENVVMKSLTKAGLKPQSIRLPAGEMYKTMATACRVYDGLLDHEMERKSVIISLGGGVIGDLGGFVAATFMRGLPFVQVATSLVSQADSSVGGKVAVNLPRGKNLVGSFYQPHLVIADIQTLKTLPEREMVAGLAEVIRHGMILDETYFSWLEQNLENILQQEEEALLHLIYCSLSIKKQVVEMDEREAHYRAILNFGHTVGHALEMLTQYERYRHGEAVAIGMVQASRLAQQMGMIDGESVNRLIHLLRRTGLPTRVPDGLDAEMIRSAIKQDKKSIQGKVKFILPRTIGQVEIVHDWWEEGLVYVLTHQVHVD